METAPIYDQPKPKLRWFQFSLRTLLIVVTFIGSGVGWLGMKVREAREQAAAVAEIERLGGEVYYDYQLDAQLSPYQLDVQCSPVPNAAPPGDAWGPAPPLLPVAKVAPPGPAWLHSLLGDDFFRTVYYIDLLNESSISDAEMEHLIRSLPKLQRLNVCGTRITDAGFEHLKGLTRLKDLALMSTLVTDDGLEHIKGLTQLERLLLDDTRVTDAGLERLSGLSQLKLLWIHRIQVTDAGVAKLQKALPNCKIER